MNPDLPGFVSTLAGLYLDLVRIPLTQFLVEFYLFFSYNKRNEFSESAKQSLSILWFLFRLSS